MEDTGYLLVMYTMFVPVFGFVLWAGLHGGGVFNLASITIGMAAIIQGVAAISIPRDDNFVDILGVQFQVLLGLLALMLLMRLTAALWRMMRRRNLEHHQKLDRVLP